MRLHLLFSGLLSLALLACGGGSGTTDGGAAATVQAAGQVVDDQGLPLAGATAEHINHLFVGALIIFFLIVEPHGLARLWSTAKEKMRLWPFPH